MSAEAVRNINAAITRHNGNPIASADDGSKEAILFHSNYERIVKQELVAASWKFARKEELLTALPDAPVNENWDHALQLPADLLLLRAVTVDGDPIEYLVGPNQTILTNEDEEVYALYTYRAPEDLWPADFEEGVVRRLEAIFLRSDEKGDLADSRDKHAEFILKRARRIHAQEESPQDHLTYPLLRARRLGYSAPRNR